MVKPRLRVITGGGRTPAPSLRRRPMLVVLRGNDASPMVAGTRHARGRTYNVLHDLEANGFFVSLTAGARHPADQSLYHWLGEAACRTRSAADALGSDHSERLIDSALERHGRSRDVVEVEIAARLGRFGFGDGSEEAAFMTCSRTASGAAPGAASGAAFHMAPGLAIQSRVRPASGLSPESTRPRLLRRLDPEANALPAPINVASDDPFVRSLVGLGFASVPSGPAARA